MYDSLTPLSPYRGIISAGSDSPEAFFMAALKDSKEGQGKRLKRLKRLNNVVQYLQRNEELDEACIKLSGWSNIFALKSDSEAKAIFEVGFRPKTTFEIEVAHRLHRLKQARHKIRKTDLEARRLWLVCVTHELEYISRWEEIGRYTKKGVDGMSAAISIAEEYLGTVKDDRKRGRSSISVMKEGGPAALLLDCGGISRSDWENYMTRDDITVLYKFKRDRLPRSEEQTRSCDADASRVIRDCFLAYGWSLESLERSNTIVAAILMDHLSQKRPHADSVTDGLESTHKRQCVDRIQQVHAPYFDHNLSAISSDQLAMSFSGSSHATVDDTPGSAVSYSNIFNIGHGTRDLADAATINNLSYACRNSNELTDAGTANILGHTVNNQEDFRDPLTICKLNHTADSLMNFTELPGLVYTTNSSGTIADLNWRSYSKS